MSELGTKYPRHCLECGAPVGARRRNGLHDCPNCGDKLPGETWYSNVTNNQYLKKR